MYSGMRTTSRGGAQVGWDMDMNQVLMGLPECTAHIKIEISTLEGKTSFELTPYDYANKFQKWGNEGNPIDGKMSSLIKKVALDKISRLTMKSRQHNVLASLLQDPAIQAQLQKSVPQPTPPPGFSPNNTTQQQPTPQQETENKRENPPTTPPRREFNVTTPPPSPTPLRPIRPGPKPSQHNMTQPPVVPPQAQPRKSPSKRKSLDIPRAAYHIMPQMIQDGYKLPKLRLKRQNNAAGNETNHPMDTTPFPEIQDPCEMDPPDLINEASTRHKFGSMVIEIKPNNQ